MQQQNSMRKTADASKLGFIGLGYMGSRIAKRLIRAGHRLVVYNRDRAKAEALASEGAEIAADPGALASAVDIVLSCLSEGGAVRNVYLREAESLIEPSQGLSLSR